jgi:hypothetical protein
MHSFEGERGLRNLNQIATELNYSESNLRFGSPLEQFLQDNPGAMQALVDWTGEHYETEFSEIMEDTESDDDEEWAEILVPEPDAMPIIRKAVESAMLDPMAWFAEGSGFTKEHITPITRLIAAIKCLRQLVAHDTIVMKFFGSNHLGLADAKHFIEKHFQIIS